MLCSLLVTALFNSRHACAARVTVVVACVCVQASHPLLTQLQDQVDIPMDSVSTTTQYSPRRHLLRGDVKLRRGHLSLLIKAFKTDSYRKTCTLPVAATGNNTCPVAAMRQFLAHARHHSSRPLFTLTSGEFLTRAHLTAVLRKLLQATGLSAAQAKQYGTHSLRIGAATDAAAAGLPSWLIQAAGWWKSG